MPKLNKSKRGAPIQTDVSKENKGYNNYQSENAVPGPSTKGGKNGGSNNSSVSNSSTGNKLQAAAKLTRKNLAKFVKKDAGAAPVMLKKTKVLGESSTTVALKIDSNRNSKDSNIPRKKIKVSPQHRVSEVNEPLITCFGETFCRNTSAVDTFDMCFTSNITTSTFSSSSLPNFFTQTPNLVDATTYQAATKKVKALSSANTLDLDDSLDAVPCCSYSLPSTSEPSLALHSATFHGKLSAARSKEFKSKFSKATSSKQQSKVTKAGSDGGKSKLKKKRTLRSDSSLKRKKTRVKPVVC